MSDNEHAKWLRDLVVRSNHYAREHDGKRLPLTDVLTASLAQVAHDVAAEIKRLEREREQHKQMILTQGQSIYEVEKALAAANARAEKAEGEIERLASDCHRFEENYRGIDQQYVRVCAELAELKGGHQKADQTAASATSEAGAEESAGSPSAQPTPATRPKDPREERLEGERDAAIDKYTEEAMELADLRAKVEALRGVRDNALPEVRALLDGLRRATNAKSLWRYEVEHDALHLLMDFADHLKDWLTEALAAVEGKG